MNPQEQQAMLASGKLMSIAQAAKLTPYSAEYLSLLARKGKLKAVKISRDWLTTEDVVKDYVKRQKEKHQKMISLLDGKDFGFAGLKLLLALGISFIVAISAFTFVIKNPASKYFALPKLKPATVSVQSAKLGLAKYAVKIQKQVSNKVAAISEALLWLGEANTNRVATVSLLTDSNQNNIEEIIPEVKLNTQATLSYGTDANNISANKVVGANDFEISSGAINNSVTEQLDLYLKQGLFKGEKGDKGDPGQNSNATVNQTGNSTTIAVGGIPMVSYYQPNPSQNFSGGSLAGFTTLSTDSFTAKNINVSGSSVFSGNLTLSGSVVIGTGGDLNVSGSATLATTTITNLTVTNLNPQFVQGSLVFQGESGLAQDGSYLYYDAATHRLALGTTTPSGVFTLKQTSNNTTLLYAQRNTDVAPSGDFIEYYNAAGDTALFRVDNSGNIYAGGIQNSGSLTVTSLSEPQFRVQYDSSNEWTASTNSSGITTFAFNGSTPKAAWIPASNSTNTFSFSNASSTSILSIDTLNGRVGIGTTSPRTALEVNGDITLGGVVNGVTSRAIYNGTAQAIRFDYANSSNAVITGNNTYSGLMYVGNARGVAGAGLDATNNVRYNGATGYGIELFADDTAGRGILIQKTTGYVGIGTTTPGYLVTLSGGAYADGSSWVNASDVHLKENFTNLDPQEMLSKISSLSIQRWNFKSQDSIITHIGPTAQDFYDLFKVGNSSTSLSTIDPAGVALLGIKALDQKILALQGAINQASTATTSLLAVYSPSNFSGDSVGQAKILAGSTSVRVTFTQAYQYQPVVTVTLTGDPLSIFSSVSDIDANGFTIKINESQTQDITFNWHSFASPLAKLTVSNGTVEDVVLIVPSTETIVQPEIIVVTPEVTTDIPQTSTSTPQTTNPEVLGTTTPLSTVPAVSPVPEPDTSPAGPPVEPPIPLEPPVTQTDPQPNETITNNIN